MVPKKFKSAGEFQLQLSINDKNLVAGQSYEKDDIIRILLEFNPIL